MLAAATLTQPATVTTGSPTVRVFHNNHAPDSFVYGYQAHRYQVGSEEMPAHTVTEVYWYTDHDSDDEHLAETAFRLFNVGDDPEFGEPDPRALEYRDRANRCLSKGDILAIEDDRGTRFYACGSFSWDLLDAPPVIDNREQHGSTPVDAPLIAYTVDFLTQPALAETAPWQVEACSRGQLVGRIRDRLVDRLALDPTRASVVIDIRDADTVWRARQGSDSGQGFSRHRADTEIATFTVRPVTA